MVYIGKRFKEFMQQFDIAGVKWNETSGYVEISSDKVAKIEINLDRIPPSCIRFYGGLTVTIINRDSGTIDQNLFPFIVGELKYEVLGDPYLKWRGKGGRPKEEFIENYVKSIEGYIELFK